MINFHPLQHAILAVSRIGFSALLMTHGYDKLMRLLSGEFQFADPIGIGEFPTLLLAVLAEFVAPIFIVVGFKTRWATLLPMGTMLVAAFVVHLPDPFNKKEHALLFFFGFLLIYVFGAGKYSADRR